MYFHWEPYPFSLFIPRVLPPPDWPIEYMHVSFCAIGSTFPRVERLRIKIRSCCWREVLFNLAKKSVFGVVFGNSWRLALILFSFLFANLNHFFATHCQAWCTSLLSNPNNTRKFVYWHVIILFMVWYILGIMYILHREISIQIFLCIDLIIMCCGRRLWL